MSVIMFLIGCWELAHDVNILSSAYGRQRRCQEDPVSLPSGRLEMTTRSSPHHVAQHRPTGSETTPPYVPQSSRFGSEPPSVEDDVDVWRYAILELHARNCDDDGDYKVQANVQQYITITIKFYYCAMLCTALSIVLQNILSVCLSHAGIMSKQLNISSNFTIGLAGLPHYSNFFRTKPYGNIPSGMNKL